MTNPFRLVGYLAIPNLEFITAVPIFSRIGSSKTQYYYQRITDGKIRSFVAVDSSADEFSRLFRSVDSKIIKDLGDSAVFIQANLGPEIVSASAQDYLDDLGAALKARGPDYTDPIVGLELAELVGDDRLAEIYFRRVARVAYSINAETARMWSSQHRLARSNPRLLNDIGHLEKARLSPVEDARKVHAFARRGFGSESEYYCSGSVLEHIGIFSLNRAIDPVTIYTRPISEVPSNSKGQFVVFVSLDDILGADGDSRFMLEYVRRGVYAGGSLVLLVDLSEEFSDDTRDVHADISRCLAVISDSLDFRNLSGSGDFLCVLFSHEPTFLRKAIRGRTSASRLGAMAALFSVQLGK